MLAFVLLASPALASDFPVTLEHKFGTTIIEAAPERVATLDYGGVDDVLALGFQPVAVRYWYGDYPYGVWPWAADLLTSEPILLEGELDFEAIAAADPDVIIALWSGITADDYEKLSLIAPVVAVPEGVGDYSMAWTDRVEMIGLAVGKHEEAKAKVQAITDKLADIAAAHPEWQDLEGCVAFAYEGQPGCHTSNDTRARVLGGFGFKVPAAIDALMTDPEGDFYVSFSEENIPVMDVDLIIWNSSSDTYEEVRALETREFLKAHQGGREVFSGALLAGAFSHSSTLSLPFAIDELLPMIEAAMDGDPSTHADNRPEGF